MQLSASVESGFRWAAAAGPSKAGRVEPIELGSKRAVSIKVDLWETRVMETRLKHPQHLEDRKVQKLIERVEKKLMLREKALRENSLEAPDSEPCQRAA
jgi:hypothetical protein